AAAAAVALYRDESDELQASLALDLRSAAFLSAALTRIPKKEAFDAIKARGLSAGLRENCDEVLNICTNLFPVERVGRLILDETLYGNAAVREHTRWACPSQRSFFADVTHYGMGALSVTTAHMPRRPEEEADSASEEVAEAEVARPTPAEAVEAKPATKGGLFSRSFWSS
ncbi:MAG: hypothetical protein AAF907_02865, partial [Planctomycetota bacterium]